MYRALIVEDDAEQSERTGAHLARGGYEADRAQTCAEALALLRERAYDLLLLELVLPDGRGDGLCRAVREDCACPIIFMSRLRDSRAVIAALESGGDDYMVLPLDYGELLARAGAISRRLGARGGHVRRFRRFAIDTQLRRVFRGGAEVELSSIEYALLLCLTGRPDTLVRYAELYRQVWASDSLGDVRTVMVHISNLRKKLDPGRSGVITTVRGAGYLFTDV